MAKRLLIFHTRLDGCGTAFVGAGDACILTKLKLYWRGYRPFCHSSYWWTKPSKNKADAERRHRIEQLFRTIR